MAGPIAIAVAVGTRPLRRVGRADGEQPVEEVEGLGTSAPGEAGAGRVGPRALLQPYRREDADRPSDLRPHAKPCDRTPQRAAGEIRASVAQADVSSDPADTAVVAGADDQGCV